MSNTIADSYQIFCENYSHDAGKNYVPCRDLKFGNILRNCIVHSKQRLRKFITDNINSYYYI